MRNLKSIMPLARHLFALSCLGGIAILTVEAAPENGTSTPAGAAVATPMFSEAGTNVIPMEQRSRRKWDNAIVADLDHDGHLDLLLTEHGQRVRLFWNNGGTFAEPYDIVQGDMHGIAIGECNRDDRESVIVYPGGGGGNLPRNPSAFNIGRDRSIEGGEEFPNFERCRGRAAKLLDLDGDGGLDLLTTGFPLPTQPEGANRLYRNNGKRGFDFVAKLPPSGRLGDRALITDFNNDGVADVILYGDAILVALRGEKGGGFTDVSKEVLGDLAGTGDVSSIAEIDYDNDGDFDLVLTRAEPESMTGNQTFFDPKTGTFAFVVLRKPFQFDDLKIEGDFIMENLQMAWPDFSVFVGAQKRTLGFKVDRWGSKDFGLKPEEAAGWPEDRSATGLYIGYLGNGMWRVGGHTDQRTSAVVHYVKSTPSVSKEKSLPVLLLENRGGKFFDVTAKLGLSIADQTASVAVGDFDNDGWSDLFFVLAGNPAKQTEQIVLLNQRGKSFAPVANAGVVSSELGAVGGGAEAFDYNEDGNLDLIFANERGRWHLFTNEGQPAKGNNYVVVKVGSSPSRQATMQGAVLTLKAGGQIYRRVVGATSAAYSMGENNHLHVGLGKWDKVDEAVVRWTDGETETIRIDALNRSFAAGHLKDIPFDLLK